MSARTLEKRAKIKEFEDLALLTTAVKSGQIDAGVNDNQVLFDYVKSQHPRHRGGHEFDTGEQYGFMMAKDQNDELLKTINETIAESKRMNPVRQALQEVLR